MKLRHVASDEPIGFQQGLDYAKDKIEEEDEVIVLVDHSMATATVKEEYGDQIEITYSAVIGSKKVVEIGKKKPRAASDA